MSLFWYFLMAFGFLVMVMLAVPDEDAPRPEAAPPAIELGTAAPHQKP